MEERRPQTKLFCGRGGGGGVQLAFLCHRLCFLQSSSKSCQNDDHGRDSTTNKLLFQNYVDLLPPESLKKETIVSENNSSQRP